MVLSINNLTGFGGGDSGAFVEQVTSGTGTGTTVSVTLPTLLSGRFLMVVLAVNGTAENPTSPSGWGVMWSNQVTASNDEWHGWTKLGDGTEGATLNITKSSTGFYSYVCFSVANMSFGTFSNMFDNDETSATPTPDAHTPTWLSSVFVTFLTSDQQTVSAYPASTPLHNTQTTGGTATQPMIAMASAKTGPRSAAFSPGDWTLASSEACTMRTVSIGNF